MKEKDGNFKIIAKEDYAGIGITKGKVYEFKDGYTRWDGGRKSYCHYEDFEEFIKHNPGVTNLFTKSTPPTELTTITIYNTPGSMKVSAVMRRGDKVIKSAKAICNVTDLFNIDFGMELAVKRLFGWEEEAKSISLVAEVKRNAKIGEYIKIKKDGNWDRKHYSRGDVYLVDDTFHTGNAYYHFESDDELMFNNKEYVVLENYHPETQVKFRKAKVGDRIKIVKSEYHEPIVNIGDIFTVTKSGGRYVWTDTGNIFENASEEYIILNR